MAKINKAASIAQIVTSPSAHCIMKIASKTFPKLIKVAFSIALNKSAIADTLNPPFAYA